MLIKAVNKTLEILLKKYFKFEKYVGSLKFAIIIISLFTVSMIAGTLIESAGGTEIASAIIYKNPLFFLLQFFLFLSILMATFQRFPLKKRLAGFYVLHTGLITIGCGSLITYFAGVDGSVFLAPKTQTREIIINKNQIKISIPEDGINATKDLPTCAFECSIRSEYKGIKFKTYLPFADKKLVWKDIERTDATPSSASYNIANGMVSENFTLSLNSSDPDFGTQINLGPLTIFYLPPSLSTCFQKNHKSGYIFWDSEKKLCFTPEDKTLKINKTSKGSNFIAYKMENKIYSFFPDIGPWPYDINFKIDRSSSIRVFSQKMFQKKPLLFLFGKKASYYEKDDKKWVLTNLEQDKAIELPWMGFGLTLTHFDKTKTPGYKPLYIFPKKVKGQFVHGGTKAISIEVAGREYWITDDKSGIFTIDGKKIKVSLGQENLFLPFQFVLDKFVMKKNPGTQMPASYESYVTVLDDNGPEKSHIYMNNPMKKQGFTFYQASYSKNSDGSYNSTLSANYDPGRPIKYLGSLLLVFGAMYHFGIAQRKKKKKTT